MAFGLLTGTSGINPDFLSRLEQLRRALPNNLGAQIGIKSGYRSPQHQADLYARAVQKYGSPQAARKWVAPPGHSQHNRGMAIDLSYGSPEAMRAAHEMAGQYGLVFPMNYENWHIEPAGARGGAGANTAQAAPAGSPDTTAAASPTPASSVADLLSKASFGGTSPAGGGHVGGIIGPDAPPPAVDLTTDIAAQTASPPVATPIAAQDPATLASLFTLPTIGGQVMPDATTPALPGQAKPLTRKVWK
jgi:hypothetical protein